MSFEEDDDDKLIDKHIAKEMGKSGIADNPKGKQMSFHPKELIKGKPTLTQDESDSVTDYIQTRTVEAKFRERNPTMQGYPLNEIKAEGNKLVIDTDKVNERKQHEAELIKKMYDEQKKSAKGVKHNVEGKTVLLKSDN
jgi:hypothetical protein